MRLLLASASPRRAALLRAAGYEFDVLRVDLDERLRDGEAAAMYVRRLAAEKSAAAMAIIAHGPAEAGHYDSSGGASSVGPDARAASIVSGFSRTRDLIILGADTSVVVDAKILGKPRDDGDAERMLRLLSGRTHVVMTGISLRRGAYELGRVITTSVRFETLSSKDISWYLASGEGRDKAGAYAIQGLASRFVTSIDGSYSNVVGLPMATVHALLTDVASDSASDYSEKASSPRKSL
jgi:septum formation protein